MPDKKSNIIVSIAAGIFLGVALTDALPEAARQLGLSLAIIWMLGGSFLWWLQKVILGRLKKPEMPVLVATALWLHSALEGIVTGLAFGISQTFGIIVLIGMIIHLLPEFFAAVALMRGAGSKNRTAVSVTFIGYLVLFTAFGITYYYLPQFGASLPIIGAISGGAFAFIGMASYWKRRGMNTSFAFLAGIIVMFILRFFLKF